MSEYIRHTYTDYTYFTLACTHVYVVKAVVYVMMPKIYNPLAYDQKKMICEDNVPRSKKT